ncbi:MAG: ZIP family metal transporter [Actinomycetota bacterium]|nr:ZIP family metal transporter [Actinomycetota bacterium]
MRCVDYLLPHVNPELVKKEKPSIKRSVAMLVIGIALHNLPEALAIGVGFAIAWKLGIIIALGIAMQDIPENIATVVPLYGITRKRLKSFMILTTTILFELVGFIIGYYFLKEASSYVLGISLAFAAGFMVYISVEELLPSAQIREYPRLTTAGIVLGLVCTLLTTLI